MSNLDKLLKKIEKNVENAEEIKTFEKIFAGETFTVKTMTRKEKRDFVYSQETGSKTIKAGDIIKKMKPFIYTALGLNEIAQKAKEAGFIKSYYDVIEALFEPTEIIEIIAYITEINNLAEIDVKEDIDDLKKP